MPSRCEHEPMMNPRRELMQRRRKWKRSVARRACRWDGRIREKCEVPSNRFTLSTSRIDFMARSFEQFVHEMHMAPGPARVCVCGSGALPEADQPSDATISGSMRRASSMSLRDRLHRSRPRTRNGFDRLDSSCPTASRRGPPALGAAVAREGNTDVAEGRPHALGEARCGDAELLGERCLRHQPQRDRGPRVASQSRTRAPVRAPPCGRRSGSRGARSPVRRRRRSSP